MEDVPPRCLEELKDGFYKTKVKVTLEETTGIEQETRQQRYKTRNYGLKTLLCTHIVFFRILRVNQKLIYSTWLELSKMKAKVKLVLNFHLLRCLSSLKHESVFS